jgi:hypothetical protein
VTAATVAEHRFAVLSEVRLGRATRRKSQSWTLACERKSKITLSSDKLSYATEIATGYGSPPISSGWTFYGCLACHKPGGIAGSVLDLQSDAPIGCFTTPADGVCSKTLFEAAA